MMSQDVMGPLILHTQIERWPMVSPFRISGYTFDASEVLVVSLEASGHVGRGEAAGVYYKNDRPVAMQQQVEQLRSIIEGGISRDSVQTLLHPCGARNALDCALWDLQAKVTGMRAWKLAQLEAPRPILTTFTCGADEPYRMATAAAAYSGARAIKLKLTGEELDAERVRAVRAALPDVWLGVDANQGFTRASLERLMRVLVDSKVALIEQPFPIGQEAWLDGLASPIPIAADESAQNISDLPTLVGRVDTINIKLDKCGGLTEGLSMAREAKRLGFGAMIGNMTGTSLAMAPAFLIGQLCEVVDLDGPVFLKSDRARAIQYVDGLISCADDVWG